MTKPVEPQTTAAADTRQLLVLPSGETGHVVRDAQCRGCDTIGQMHVTPFVWRGSRRLHWHCHQCRRVWIEAERRRQSRATSADSVAYEVTTAMGNDLLAIRSGSRPLSPP